MYVYDKVFKPNVTQENVYDTVAKPIVKGKARTCTIVALLVVYGR